jgi:hypothetical protein
MGRTLAPWDLTVFDWSAPRLKTFLQPSSQPILRGGGVGLIDWPIKPLAEKMLGHINSLLGDVIRLKWVAPFGRQCVEGAANLVLT